MSEDQARFDTGNTTLLFMHIPKTAGTSVRALLEEFYDEDSKVYLYDEPPGITPQELNDFSDERKRRVKLVYGHFHFGVHEMLPQPTRYLTILREPVDRVVSLYYHYKRVEGNRFHDLIVKDGLSLEEFVFGAHTLQTDNEMVRQIAAQHRVHFGTCSDELLERAWNHVEQHFAGIMFMDEMEDGMQNLRTMLGLPPKELGKENVNKAQPPRASIDPAVLDKIREFSRFDCELYQRAKLKYGGIWPVDPVRQT